MRSSWESIVVAIGIILLFYFARRYTPGQKSPKTMKKGSRPKEETKPLEMILTKKEMKHVPVKPSPSSQGVASLVMHPHSFERAKREYMRYAQQFSGFYEVLFLSCSGKLSGPRQEQLLKDWEEGILGTDAPNFILAWNTIIQKYCGRNFYFKGNIKGKGEQGEEERILQSWLKILFRWGLHRELKGQIQLEPHGGEPIGAQEQNYFWVLNGEVLEEGRGESP
ncbi:hypothetical protein Desde_2704 [Desulfitobacterium dehalogenans ATCC 51507]|uniref:Uncharacterized protein n=1 Tax=Desulfitobacterium dehalogenans (strain ATCC 51507 / DSM 9161 / JW/IU-DC1) TaxID=756499 RepID=I4AAN2_DESDJ|nr:hypothetical protein [Desulfitobacterium dehalogenans]AFM01017.1 hypothetical protein Desde_2704 [Desulfitobacterium dehalogenans ATCC 51507]